MKSLILVQHCQSRHHVDRAAAHGPDCENGLTDLGRQQAARVAGRLRQWLDGMSCRIYSSDITRAWQTAQILGDQLAQPPEPVPALREGCARLAGPLPADPPPPQPAGRTWMLFDSRREPDVETWRQFHARVAAAMERIIASHPGSCVPIIVTHGGTLSNIVAWWLRLPLDVLPERDPFAASPGSITVLRTNRHGNPSIERLNDRAHLDPSAPDRPRCLACEELPDAHSSPRGSLPASTWNARCRP